MNDEGFFGIPHDVKIGFPAEGDFPQAAAVQRIVGEAAARIKPDGTSIWKQEVRFVPLRVTTSHTGFWMVGAGLWGLKK